MSSHKSNQAVWVRALVSDHFQLMKPRPTLLASLAVTAGFFLGAGTPWSWVTLGHIFYATLLIGMSGAILNQCLEKTIDSRMKRTQGRPIASGRIGVRQAAFFASCLGVIGIIHFLLFVNGLSAIIAAFILITYVGCYTPLKVRTSHSIWVGALPGALPPVLGWVAATGQFQWESFVLFLILFVWQFPHFFAIAWVYRDDYIRAKIPNVATRDPHGHRTVRMIRWGSVALWAASLIPGIVGMSGPLYIGGVVLLGSVMMVLVFSFRHNQLETHSKQYVHFSVSYLTLLMGVMLMDRWWAMGVVQ